MKLNGNSPPKPRGKPFEKGNSGRKPGSKNKAKVLLEALTENVERQLIAKSLELALNGNPLMLRFWLERTVPKERLVQVDLPQINSRADLARAHESVLGAVSRGEIAPAEAASLTEMLANISRYLIDVEVEREITEMKAELRSLTSRDATFFNEIQLPRAQG